MFIGADQLARLDATAQADLVRAGEVTAVELVEAAIDRIDALNPTLLLLAITPPTLMLSVAYVRTAISTAKPTDDRPSLPTSADNS